jgi:hypothetical protein
VTDEATPKDYLSQLANNGTECLIAPTSAGSANVA